MNNWCSLSCEPKVTRVTEELGRQNGFQLGAMRDGEIGGEVGRKKAAREKSTVRPPLEGGKV
jgi:hypothetical protein